MPKSETETIILKMRPHLLSELKRLLVSSKSESIEEVLESAVGVYIALMSPQIRTAEMRLTYRNGKTDIVTRDDILRLKAEAYGRLRLPKRPTSRD